MKNRNGYGVGDGCAVALTIFETDRQLLTELLRISDEEPAELEIRLMGGGGDAHLGFAAYEILRELSQRGSRTVARVYFAHSAGIFWALGCSERIGFPTSTLMIHAPTFTLGDTSEIRGGELRELAQHTKVVERLRDQLIDDRTHLADAVINGMLASGQELWLDAKQAVGFGFLSRIEDTEQGASVNKASANGVYVKR